MFISLFATMRTSTLLYCLAAVTTVKADSWGPAWSLGPTHGSAAVIEATTHFTPGAAPNPSYDGLFLWPGTSNGTSGLIQAGCDSVANMAGYCGAATGQWCCGASYFGCINGACSQYSGSYVPVNACDTLTINYKLQSDQKTWVQTVTLAGKVISTLQSYDGPLLQGGFGTGTECQTNCHGSVATQFYTDTTVVLSSADSQFGNTLGVGAGIVSTALYTPDGGKTWKVDSIRIPPMKIDANGNPVSHPETSTCTPQATGTATTTKPVTTTTSATPTATGVVPKYGQCGGIGYTGSTTCAAGSTCTYSNAYYSQCL